MRGDAERLNSLRLWDVACGLTLQVLHPLLRTAGLYWLAAGLGRRLSGSPCLVLDFHLRVSFQPRKAAQPALPGCIVNCAM